MNSKSKNLKNYPQYFLTSDRTRIFFVTNFALEFYDENRPLLVFNYGLVCSSAHFSKQLEFFSHQGHQTLIYNYRGHYNSSGQHSINTITFNNMVQDLHELLDSFAAKNICMLGHSMGVNITLEYCRQYGTNLVSMVLISGTISPPQDHLFDSNIMHLLSPYITYISKNYRHLYRTIWRTNFLNPLLHKALHVGGFNTSIVPIEFVQLYAKRISELPAEIFLQLLNEMKKHDIAADLEQITTPALIIAGDEDKIIPSYLQYVLHNKLANSSIYMVKECGHVPQIEFPELVNDKIKLFIKSNS